ncbi:uncharacterized protein [Dermacentor albipictus]|uniref:uncharacterized protein isoform X2 n=1 Tax=Dermacentor albipictus TaxID=60249 RepID=UPI0031FD87EB
MRSSSARKSSSKKKKVPSAKSTRPKEGGGRSSAETRAMPGAATSQQTLQASACSQQPPDQHKHTPSTAPQPQYASPSGPLTPDWFTDERWATLLGLKSDRRRPSNLRPDRPPSTAQQPPATTVQRPPSSLRDGEPRILKSTAADVQPSLALLPYTPSTRKLVAEEGATADEAASLRPPDAQLTADRHTSAAPGKQPPVRRLGSQQAVADAATPAPQPSAETTSRSRYGTDAEFARAATLAVRPSTPSGLPEITFSGPDGKASEIARAVSSGSQTSLTASPPQSTSMSRERTDAEIDRVVSPLTPPSAPSSIPETTPRSPQGTDDVEAIRVTTPAAQPSAPESLPRTTSRSPEGTATTPAAPASVQASTPETTMRSPQDSEAEGVRERPEAEDDSAVSQRCSGPLTNRSRSTPSVVRILEDGVISGSHRSDSASATATVDTGQGTSTQCPATPLGEHKRGRKADTGVPSLSPSLRFYGAVLDATTDSVVSMAGSTGELSWATEAKARGLLFTLLHCLTTALLNILIKQVVHIPKAKIAYYVAFGYMLGSMPEAFALKNPFAPRHVQVDLVLRGVCSLTSLMLKAEALRYVVVSDLAVAYTMVPVCVTLLSWYFMNESMGLTMWLSISLCLSGIVVVMRPAIFFKEWDEETTQTRLIGFLFVNFNSGLTRTIMSLLMAMATGTLDELMDGRYLGTLVMMSKLGFCAIFFLNKALQIESGAFVATVKFSADVIMSVILQIAFLDLYPDVWSMGGIVLVVLSFLVTICGSTVKPAWKNRRRRKSIQKRRRSLKAAEEQDIAAMAAAAAAEAAAAAATSGTASSDAGAR